MSLACKRAGISCSQPFRRDQRGLREVRGRGARASIDAAATDAQPEAAGVGGEDPRDDRALPDDELPAHVLAAEAGRCRALARGGSSGLATPRPDASVAEAALARAEDGRARRRLALASLEGQGHRSRGPHRVAQAGLSAWPGHLLRRHDQGRGSVLPADCRRHELLAGLRQALPLQGSHDGRRRPQRPPCPSTSSTALSSSAC